MKIRGILLILLIFIATCRDTSLQIQTKNVSPQVVALVMEAIALVYKTLVALFGVTQKTEKTQIFREKGYEFFGSCSSTDVYEEVDEEALPYIRELLIGMWGKNMKEGEATVNALMDIIDSTKTNTWSENNVSFNKGDTGKMNYGAIYHTVNKDNKYNFIIMDSKITFSLSQDIFVVKSYLKVGIFYEGEKQTIVYKDRAIEQADIDSMMYFLQISAYKYLSKQAGIELEE